MLLNHSPQVRRTTQASPISVREFKPLPAMESVLKKKILLNMSLIGISLSLPVLAGPADYIYTPKIERGELELDIKYGTATSNTSSHPEASSIGLGYGMTERWFTEGYLKQKHDASGVSHYAEWENRFLLSSTGDSAVDIGFVTELEAPLTVGSTWELRAGPLFQSQIEKLQLNGNLIFERVFGGSDEYGVAQVTNFGYQWQARYRWEKFLQFGIQGFGELGKWNDWYPSTEQNHRMGPALFGKFSFDQQHAIKYNAAWLAGLSAASPATTLRVQIEYEF
jgi:hypothetical protein